MNYRITNYRITAYINGTALTYTRVDNYKIYDGFVIFLDKKTNIKKHFPKDKVTIDEVRENE